MGRVPQRFRPRGPVQPNTDLRSLSNALADEQETCHDGVIGITINNELQYMSPVRFPKPVSGRIDPKASSERRPSERKASAPRPASRPKPPARTSEKRPPAPKDRPADSEAPQDEDDGFIPLVSGVPGVLELLESAPERVDAVFLRKGRHGKDMERVVDLCRNAGVRFSLLEAEAFVRTCPGARGAAARVFQAGFSSLEQMLDSIMDAPLPLIVALDQVQDPGNAGTLARTIYAMGGAGMLVPRHNGVYLGAAAFKAAAGALALLPVAKCANLGQALDQARKLGITVYGAAVEAEGDTPVHDIFAFSPRLPAILVLGGEDSGLRPGVEKRCDALLRIPMLRSFNSLNVAQAGAIVIAQFAQGVGKKK